MNLALTVLRITCPRQAGFQSNYQYDPQAEV